MRNGKHFFDYDGYLNTILTKIMYIVCLNFLFILCSIPIVTVGASATAMYTVLLRFAEGDEPDILKSFFRAFRDNLKKATTVWIGILAVAVTLMMNYYLIYQMGGITAEVLRVFMNLILLALSAFCVYIFPSMAYYENSIIGYLEFSFRIALGQLPRTILMLAVHTIPLLFVLYLAQYFTVAVLLLVCCGISLPAYYAARILKKLFKIFEEKTV